MVADIFARDCSSRSVVEAVAGKWGTLVMLALGEEPRRFNALRRRVDGVSEKMLSQTLQTLERDGMVIRDVQKEIPPRVEYSLTVLGGQVAARLRSLVGLVEDEIGAVTAARLRYDAR
ncbi:helix-turn-helix domain-containing protein [Nakamurella sp. PAMC28650]|uniref:winged helix-turn-helix transcriptional regulator n=1 Tax=Nakamurella sp. PAMC28650 TaxID=2762325 RepID=UPI00164D2C98|nr:helix-turn-helix transcriptional regulator [Nakamurella sp. PAMC28650]